MNHKTLILFAMLATPACLQGVATSACAAGSPAAKKTRAIPPNGKAMGKRILADLQIPVGELKKRGEALMKADQRKSWC
jgi:hypothetical protein